MVDSVQLASFAAISSFLEDWKENESLLPDDYVDDCIPCFEKLDSSTADKLAALKTWRQQGLLPQQTLKQLYSACAEEIKLLNGQSVHERLSALRGWQQDGLVPPKDDNLYEPFKAVVKELVAQKTRLSLGQQAGASQRPQSAEADAPAAAMTEASVQPATPDTAAIPAAIPVGLDDVAPLPCDLEPLTAQALYAAANRRITPLVKFPKGFFRDHKYQQTVEDIPFQVEAIRAVVENELHPKTVPLKIDGQPYTVQLPSGSLLFDVMGLGKTMEALGVILANPREKGAPGTLVLAPAVVTGQWMDEIAAHSTLIVLLYTGLTHHASPQQEFYSVDSKGHRYTELSRAGLQNQRTAKIQQVEQDARAQGKTQNDINAAKQAVREKPFNSLASDFSKVLRRYDVVIMSYEDAELEATYITDASRQSDRNGSSSCANSDAYMQTPLLAVGEFKRLVLDECHRVGGVSSRAGRMAMAIRAKHRLLMSGTPFPPGREAAAAEATLKQLFQSCDSLCTSSSSSSSQPEDNWLRRTVERAMKPRASLPVPVANEAQQAMLKLMSILMIRRTHEDVTEQFKVPAQHHVTKVVPLTHCSKFVVQLLHKAARRALKAVPAGKEAPGKLIQTLYNRLAGASLHPQYDRLVTGGEQILEQYGAFTDPHALPIRHGKILEVCPQDVMAGALQDAALSHMVRLTSNYAAASHQLGNKLAAEDRLGGPDIAGARSVVEEAFSFLQSGLPIFIPGTMDTLDFTTLDVRRGAAEDAGPSTATFCRGSKYTAGEYMADAAFAGYRPARKAYALACHDLNDNIGHLKGLRARLKHPQGPLATAAADAATEDDSAVIQPGSSTLLQDRLADAVKLLEESLSELEGSQPLPEDVDELGGLDYMQNLLASSKTGLDAVEIHEWFVQLKQQRQVVLDAVAALTTAPATDAFGYVTSDALAMYSAALVVADQAATDYSKRQHVRQLLRRATLTLKRRVDPYQGSLCMDGLLRNLILVVRESGEKEIIHGWCDTLQRMNKERLAAAGTLSAAHKVAAAAKRLAPKDSKRSIDILEAEVEQLQCDISDLKACLNNTLQRLASSTKQLGEAAKEHPFSKESAECKYGSLLAEVADMLLKIKAESESEAAGDIDTVKEQVVLVCCNKMVYFDLTMMLDALDITYDHLDSTARFESSKTITRLTHRKRSKREGLDNFKAKKSMVLLLNVLDVQQAYGITLVNASRMIVVDPVLSETTLHQVLSRIHRYGQKKEQEVTFLVPQGTILGLLHTKFVLPMAKSFLERGGRIDLPDETDEADDQQTDVAVWDSCAPPTLGALDGLSSCSAGRKLPSAQEVPQAEMLNLLKQLLGC